MRTIKQIGYLLLFIVGTMILVNMAYESRGYFAIGGEYFVIPMIVFIKETKLWKIY